MCIHAYTIHMYVQPVHTHTHTHTHTHAHTIDTHTHTHTQYTLLANYWPLVTT